MAERQLMVVRQEEERMAALVVKLKHQQVTLHALQKQEQAWADLPNSTALEQMNIGALTLDDDAWLEQEYTSTARPRVPISPPKSPDIVSGQVRAVN